ncbi:MAG TPA: hypothetical protein VK674_06980 [Candidatus Limnocylindria bacterium]|nr:hypothetical protein [Candidatus Limnocylindria bacterium]
MKKVYIVGASVLSGAVLAVAVAAPAFAWHPKGQINKSVQNVTQNGVLSDANTAAHAVEAKTGDVLKYVIEIKNVGSAASNGYNDMHYTVLKDTLPEGVELVSDPAKREIVESLGVLKPGQKVTKSYDVRVTSDQDKAVVTNKACYTGDSEVRDNKQAGCDDAVIKVSVPQPPTTPELPKTPETPEKPQVLGKGVTTLPATGAGGIIGAFVCVTGLGSIVHAVTARKRK